MSDDNSSLQDLLDQHDYELPEEGDIRTGTIVAITQQGIIVDLGVKRDGIVPIADVNKLEPEERDALKVNDEVPVYVVQTSDPESLVVSIHLARLNQDWIEAEALLASGEMFEGEVIGYNKGGLIVPFGRIRGFVPISHLSDIGAGMSERRRQQNLAKMRGEVLGLKIIEVDRHRHRLVLSQREASREWEEKKKADLMEVLAEGDVRVGRISGVRDFGVFVDLGGADGLIHISELSWHRIDHPREVFKRGDEIEVYVLGIDQETGRISLSRKKLMENPWDTVSERYAINDLVEGRITRILDYGAFAEIEPGIEGLLHVSQLSRSPVEDPRTMVNEGELHLLRIVSIDERRQRIGLSLKAVTANEQIEWMAQRELEQAQRAEEEAAAATAAVLLAEAEEDLDVAEAAEEVAATASAAIAEAAEEAAAESLAEADEKVAEAAEVLDELSATEEAQEEVVAEIVAAAEEEVAEVQDTVVEAVEVADAGIEESIAVAAETGDDSVVDNAFDAAADLVEDTMDSADDLIDDIKEAASEAIEAVVGDESADAE